MLPKCVRELMLGAIRLEWWRETVEGAAKGNPRSHDVARGLSALFAETGLKPADLEAMIVARGFDSSNEYFSDFAALENYLDATGGALMRLAAELSGGDPRGRAGRRHWPTASPDAAFVLLPQSPAQTVSAAGRAA